MELQGERLELFNEIVNLDTESLEKVKKYIKRIASNRYTDEEIENAMRPFTDEEKIERLMVAETDPVYYTQEEMRKAAASWRNL